MKSDTLITDIAAAINFVEGNIAIRNGISPTELKLYYTVFKRVKGCLEVINDHLDEKVPFFKKGDFVSFLVGQTTVAGRIVEDRGPFGSIGRLYRIEYELNSDKARGLVNVVEKYEGDLTAVPENNDEIYSDGVD